MGKVGVGLLVTLLVTAPVAASGGAPAEAAGRQTPAPSGGASKIATTANSQTITVVKNDSAHASVNNRHKPHENITGKHGQEGQYTKTVTWSEAIDGTNALLVVFLEVESVDPVTWHHLQYTPGGGRAIDLKEATGASHCQIEAPAGGMQTFIYYLPLGNVTKGRGTISIRLTFEDTGTANVASLVFYGVDQSNPIFSAANGGAKKDARTLSTTISAGTGNKVIASIIGDNHAHAWEPNSGQTKQWELQVPTESKSSMAVGTLHVKDAGNTDIRWTASDTWGRAAHSLVVLNPVQDVPSRGPRSP
jgi:hypothetical protein